MSTSSEHLNKYPLDEQDYVKGIIITIVIAIFEEDECIWERSSLTVSEWEIGGQENMEVESIRKLCRSVPGPKTYILTAANCFFPSHMAQTQYLCNWSLHKLFFEI